MRDMFYNYEHKIDEKEYPPMKHHDHPRDSIGVHGADLLRNIKGDVIGVKAKQNSDFSLFFYLDGTVEDGSLAQLVDEASFYLLVYGKDDEAIAEFAATKYSTDQLEVDMGADDSVMPYGLYRMKLIMIYNNVTYTLFSERDAVLSIQ